MAGTATKGRDGARSRKKKRGFSGAHGAQKDKQPDRRHARNEAVRDRTIKE